MAKKRGNEMAKKEWVLNIAFNRWQFNRPRYVGELSEMIRECAPKTLQEWEQYYLSQTQLPGIKQMLGGTMEEHLKEVGRRLYAKISEQLRAEIEEITEDDCIRYVREVVINRTYKGYETEKETVYKQLEHTLGVKLEPAPDEWDRAYNVDFYIPVGDKAIIGIKLSPPIPVSTERSQDASDASPHDKSLNTTQTTQQRPLNSHHNANTHTTP